MVNGDQKTKQAKWEITSGKQPKWKKFLTNKIKINLFSTKVLNPP